MRALLPLLPDPTDLVFQGEQFRAGVLAQPVNVGTPGLAPVLRAPVSAFPPLVQANGILGPETLDGPIPRQSPLPFDIAARPRANAGIMTSAGFIAVYANECRLNRFEQSTSRFSLSGVTRDSGNSALANCVVRVFDGSNLFLGETISDGSGNYSFSLPNNSGPFYVVAWDVATGLITGASARTLRPAEV